MRETVRLEQIEAWKQFLRTHPEDIVQFTDAMYLFSSSHFSNYLMDAFRLYVDPEPFVSSLDLREALNEIRTQLNIPANGPSSL